MATDASQTRARPGSILRGVNWETYNQLRDHPGNGHLRLTFFDGSLFVMSPEMIHDRYGRRLALIIDETTEVWGIFVEGIATTTLRKKSENRTKGTGKEPDYAFYFGPNAERMHQRNVLDLDVDPPPDLAIEVDHKADSRKALALYARLGIPEVWRYHSRSRKLWFGRLSGDHYEEIPRSQNLPRLTPELVLQALERIEEFGTSAARPWLREWARALPDPSA